VSFDIDATEYTSETDTHGNMPKPGQYHVEIVKWDDSFSKTDAIIAEFGVLAGTTPGQMGKVHTEFFATGSKADDPTKRAKGTKFCLDRIATCAMAAGVVRPGEHKAIEASDMLGRDLVIALEEDTYNGKTRVKIPFCQMWPATHPDVADVPKGATAMDAPFNSDVSDL